MADLMSYLPFYYAEVVETNALMDTENPEINGLLSGLSEVLSNQFIVTSDSARLKRWEKVLNIQAGGESLDYRRTLIIMLLSTKAPLTIPWLQNKLTELVGENRFVITLYPDKYELFIRITNDRLGLSREIHSYLRKKIPANITLTVELLMTYWGEVLNEKYFTWRNVLNSVTVLNRSVLTVGEAWIMNVFEFFGAHTWQDVLSYELAEDEGGTL